MNSLGIVEAPLYVVSSNNASELFSVSSDLPLNPLFLTKQLLCIDICRIKTFLEPLFAFSDWFVLFLHKYTPHVLTPLLSVPSFIFVLYRITLAVQIFVLSFSFVSYYENSIISKSSHSTWKEQFFKEFTVYCYLKANFLQLAITVL